MVYHKIWSLSPFSGHNWVYNSSPFQDRPTSKSVAICPSAAGSDTATCLAKVFGTRYFFKKKNAEKWSHLCKFFAMTFQVVNADVLEASMWHFLVSALQLLHFFARPAPPTPWTYDLHLKPSCLWLSGPNDLLRAVGPNRVATSDKQNNGFGLISCWQPNKPTMTGRGLYCLCMVILGMVYYYYYYIYILCYIIIVVIIIVIIIGISWLSWLSLLLGLPHSNKYTEFVCLGYHTFQSFKPGLRSRQKGKVLTFHPRPRPRGQGRDASWPTLKMEQPLAQLCSTPYFIWICWHMW